MMQLPSPQVILDATPRVTELSILPPTLPSLLAAGSSFADEAPRPRTAQASVSHKLLTKHLSSPNPILLEAILTDAL